MSLGHLQVGLLFLCALCVGRTSSPERSLPHFVGKCRCSASQFWKDVRRAEKRRKGLCKLKVALELRIHIFLFCTASKVRRTWRKSSTLSNGFCRTAAAPN